MDRKKSIDKSVPARSPAKTYVILPLFIVCRSLRSPNNLNITVNSTSSPQNKALVSPSSGKTPIADLKPIGRERINSISGSTTSGNRSRAGSAVATPTIGTSNTLSSLLPNVTTPKIIPTPTAPKSNSPPKSPRHRFSFSNPGIDTPASILTPPAVSPSTILPKPSELGSRSPRGSFSLPGSTSPRTVIDKNGGFFNKLPAPLVLSTTVSEGGNPAYKQIRSSPTVYKPASISSIDNQLENKNPAMLATVC